MNKSYKEILKTCKCISYDTYQGTSAEVWFDETKTYKCIWLPENIGELPTTIYVTTN